MNESINRCEELLKSDEVFQKKLANAVKAYTGEKTEKAIFDNATDRTSCC